jgi:hypothetical protein
LIVWRRNPSGRRARMGFMPDVFVQLPGS